MIVSEDEAKRFWCPMVKNRGTENEPVTKENVCLGSGCMMWRYVDLSECYDGYCGLVKYELD